MSFFGFDTSGRHNTTAPGFSQAPDPFAGLSGGDIGDDALDFEDTYDGLGDQLDDAEDAFNDDTFGGDISGAGSVGKDFDFSGQTAKVADAIEEEHLRFNRQQPVSRLSTARAQPLQFPAELTSHYPYAEQPQRPARTGYEKYRDAEPVPDLHVDQSIWGIASSKAPAVAAAQQPAPVQPPQTSRKVMSLEEVEAAMRAQPKPMTQAPPAPEPVSYPTGQPGYPSLQQQQQQQQQQQHQAPPQPLQPQQALPSQPYPGNGPGVTILQRPQSIQPKFPGSMPPMPPMPQHLPQQSHQQPQQHQHQHQHQQQYQQPQQHPNRQPLPAQPVQILQNPNRLSGDAARLAAQGHRPSRSQGSVSRMALPQGHPHAHPPGFMHAQQPPPVPMSEEEKAQFLELEAKRAKRNHKIWVLSKDNGLMTPQDKNFITRIQLQQLVSATGHPTEQEEDMSLSEDFYYQVYSHIRAGQRQNPSQPLSNFAQTYLYQTGTRHGGGRRHGRPAENHIQRMEQQVQRAVEAAKNKPKNPQLSMPGSLGKISFSNAKTPKTMLSIKRPDNEPQRPSTGKKNSEKGLDQKRILRNVEAVYETLMKIEDHARFIPPPLSGPANPELEERHGQWASVLEGLNAKLWSELKVHEPIGLMAMHPFIAFLSCAKGKKAIPRIFPHLSFEQRTTILTMIVYHLDQLDVVRGSVDDNGETHLNSRMRENIDLFISTVMPSLMQYFNDTGLDIVDGVLNLIATKLNMDLVVRTRIGVSMLTLILSRAVLLKQTGGGNKELWDKWEQTFETLFSRLEPSLPTIFPGSVNAGVDVHVWQLLAAMGVSATHEQQTRLVLAVKDRVLDTVSLSKTLPPAMAAERLGSVNLFMRAIGLDVELLQ